MALSNSEKRPLPFNLRYPETVFGFSPDDGFSVIPLNDIFPDNETRVKLEFELSLEEYVALASAIDVGSDIAYNEDAQWIWWIWVRAIRGLSMTCEDFIDCIETDTDVQNALYTWAVNSGIYDPNTTDELTPNINLRFPPSERSMSLSDAPSGCDKDILWAGIYSIVERLDDAGRTILETAITYNDVLERWGNFASAIPLIGNTIQAIQQSVSEIIPDVYNLFAAHSSQVNREAIACSIFEIVCQECRYPTWNELFNVYAANAVGGLSDLNTLTLRAVLEGFVASGGFAASIAYNTVILLELFALYSGGKVLGLDGHSAITFMAKLGEDSPSNDWELLCSGCADPVEWAYYQDFKVGVGNWTLIGSTTQQNGVGLVSYAAAGQQNCLVLLNLDASYNWTHAQIKYSRTGGVHGLDAYRVVFWTAYPSSTGRVNYQTINNEGDGSFDRCYTPTEFNVDRKQISFAIEGNEAGQVIIESIKVWGTDSNTPPSPLVDNSSPGCD